MGNLPNLWRTDVEAYAMIGGKRFPISYGETCYRLDDIPTGYIEVPLGRKVHSRRETNAPAVVDTSWIAGLPPLSPVQVYLKCTPRGKKPPQGYGYLPGEYMRVFDGFAVSPWVSKRRGGQAVASLTSMGQIMKLATSAPYMETLQPPLVGGKGPINVRFGQTDRAAHNLTAALLQRFSNPSEHIVDVIKEIFKEIVAGVTVAKRDGVNRGGQAAVARLFPSRGGKGLDSAQFRIQHGSGGKGTTEFRTNLDCNIMRVLGDVALTDWSHGPQDGGGDLWNVLQKMARLFMFSIVATPGDKDLLVPLCYGSSQPPFKNITANEYWGVDFGKTFTMRDYAYVTDCFLHSPLLPPVLAPGLGTEFTIPHVGSASISHPADFPGRTSFLECPFWAVPPYSLTPDFIKKGKPLPDRAAMDDPNSYPSENPPGYWADADLGHNIAYYGCTFQTFAHRVMALRGRLRYDIAPGSLLNVEHNEDLFVKKSQKPSAYLGIPSEIRTSFGARGNNSIAETTISLSHYYNPAEQKYWTRADHPLYNETFFGATLVPGVE